MTRATEEPAPCAKGVPPQHFRIQRPQVDQVGGEPEVFLGQLHFQHLIGSGQCAEQRMDRLARLEVEGPVLDLHEDVWRKLSHRVA